MKDKKYKVTIYDGNRIVVQKNYNHFLGAKIKNRILPTKKRNKDNPFITTKKYIHTLKQQRKKLYQFKLIPNQCIYLTLTTANTLN